MHLQSRSIWYLLNFSMMLKSAVDSRKPKGFVATLNPVLTLTLIMFLIVLKAYMKEFIYI